MHEDLPYGIFICEYVPSTCAVLYVTLSLQFILTLLLMRRAFNTRPQDLFERYRHHGLYQVAGGIDADGIRCGCDNKTKSNMDEEKLKRHFNTQKHIVPSGIFIPTES